MREMNLHGRSLIAGRPASDEGKRFSAFSTLTMKNLPGEFFTASPREIDAALNSARDAFPAFRGSSGEQRATFLETIARILTEQSEMILSRANLETGLSLARLQSEMNRTTGHLMMFASISRDGSWLDTRHVPADPERRPNPRPDLKRTFRPIGPVVVFGSSNFPLAYSVAGGDAASALATGNPVVVKAHEAHPGTSELVANAIVTAAKETGLPAGVFSMLQGSGKELGIPLVAHPATRAVGFTGSTVAGKIFIDAASKRQNPIPVFAEMGSLNPVVLTESALKSDSERIAELLTASITTDAGQFCTKPGIVFLPSGEPAEAFLSIIRNKAKDLKPVPMLHPGIYEAFHNSAKILRSLPTIETISHIAGTAGEMQGSIHFLKADAETFLADERVREEHFGPLSIFVTYSSIEQLEPLLRSLNGQLTASLFIADGDTLTEDLFLLLEDSAGRIIMNGVPTGVEVNAAIQHGGPWPACSDSRFTAVGPAALLRFVRPVSYQNFPVGFPPPDSR